MTDSKVKAEKLTGLCSGLLLFKGILLLNFYHMHNWMDIAVPSISALLMFMAAVSVYREQRWGLFLAILLSIFQMISVVFLSIVSVSTGVAIDFISVILLITPLLGILGTSLTLIFGYKHR